MRITTYLFFLCLSLSVYTLTYLTPQNPSASIASLYKDADFKKTVRDIEAMGGETPEDLEKLAENQKDGDPEKSAAKYEKSLKKDKDEKKAKKSAEKKKKDEKKAKKAEKAEKAKKAEKKSSKEKTSKVSKKEAKKEKQEKMYEKYVAKAKNEKKIAAIKTSNKSVPKYECSHGECCDIKNGRFLTAGVTCHRSPCSGPSQCLGISAECPPSTSFLKDGTACPEGYCSSGVCVKGIYKPTNATVTKKQEVVDKEDVTIFAVDHKLPCTQGGCCDLKTGFVKVQGTSCTASKHECYEAVGTCNGYEYKCPRKAVANGTPCSNGGTCQNGVCTSNTKPPKKAKLSEDNQKQSDEIDIDIAKLESKIARANHRQKVLEKAMKYHKQETTRRFLRNALNLTNKKIKSELDLAKRSVYPYQTTTSPEELLDTGDHDNTIHDYVKQIALEQKRQNEETLRRANAALQSSNASKDNNSKIYIVIACFVMFVIALCLIVAIVKSSRSSSKKKNKTKDEYDSF